MHKILRQKSPIGQKVKPRQLHDPVAADARDLLGVDGAEVLRSAVAAQIRCAIVKVDAEKIFFGMRRVQRLQHMAQPLSVQRGIVAEHVNAALQNRRVPFYLFREEIDDLRLHTAGAGDAEVAVIEAERLGGAPRPKHVRRAGKAAVGDGRAIKKQRFLRHFIGARRAHLSLHLVQHDVAARGHQPQHLRRKRRVGRQFAQMRCGREGKGLGLFINIVFQRVAARLRAAVVQQRHHGTRSADRRQRELHFPLRHKAQLHARGILRRTDAERRQRGKQALRQPQHRGIGLHYIIQFYTVQDHKQAPPFADSIAHRPHIFNENQRRFLYNLQLFILSVFQIAPYKKRENDTALSKISKATRRFFSILPSFHDLRKIYDRFPLFPRITQCGICTAALTLHIEHAKLRPIDHAPIAHTVSRLEVGVGGHIHLYSIVVLQQQVTVFTGGGIFIRQNQSERRGVITHRLARSPHSRRHNIVKISAETD